MNTLTHIFLIALGLGIAIEYALGRRHIRHIQAHQGSVPHEFKEKIPLEAHQKAAAYTRGKVTTNFFESALSGVLILAWTLGGGLQALDQLWRSSGLNSVGSEHWTGELWIGTGVILSVFVIIFVLSLPMSVYRTFYLEQHFGFNKTTVRTFVMDQIKSLMIGAGIGIPMIILVLSIMFLSGGLWWLYVWFAWLAFSLLMLWVYPAIIAPLFNEFTPLADGELRDRIRRLLMRNGFKDNGIFMMDGSTRSTHGNAYFTGLGSNKRIVFFDTLIDELSTDEIEAVLTHELGHFKRRHIAKRMIVLAGIMLAGLAILGVLIDAPWFYHGLGLAEPSTYMGLVLFVMVSPVFTFFLQPIFSYISRRHEFEADDFASQQTAPHHLVQALVKLYRENANTLTPDPAYSAFYDSHPPAPVRIAHLLHKAS